MTDKYIHINCDHPNCIMSLRIPLDQKPEDVLEMSRWVTIIENDTCGTYCSYHGYTGRWEVKTV